MRLARDLADRTGKSVTETIRVALERALAERARVIAMREIAEEFQRHIPPEWVGRTSKEIMDGIYNEDASFAE